MGMTDIGDWCRMWLRPRSLKHTPTKKGSNPKWEREEAHYAMPVHTRVHQVLTVALLDHDSNGDDEIGRYSSVHQRSCRCCVCLRLFVSVLCLHLPWWA